MKIFDAHAHIGSEEELEARRKQKIGTFLCGTNPEDSQYVERASQTNKLIFPTYGLHPWYADQYQVEDMLPFIEKGTMLGEIGMDSVWCTVSLERQKEVFVEQLRLAEKIGLPIVLHTKGQEKEILECIQPYSIPTLVHWYSCADYLQGYIEKDCYFTVGPDVFYNPAMQSVVEKVSLDRLLVETDGFSAVQWAMEQFAMADESQDKNREGFITEGSILTLEDLSDLLLNIMQYIASIKKVTLDEVSNQLEVNFNFLKHFRIK